MILKLFLWFWNTFRFSHPLQAYNVDIVSQMTMKMKMGSWMTTLLVMVEWVQLHKKDSVNPELTVGAMTSVWCVQFVVNALDMEVLVFRLFGLTVILASKFLDRQNYL